MLLLNHRTAPDLPVVWAARMSMSVPLLWQEVEWQGDWGAYRTWNPATKRLEPNDITGHVIVDGGLLSNFPIALFVADRPDVTAVVGPAQRKNVLGLLIDESLPVPNRPPPAAGSAASPTCAPSSACSGWSTPPPARTTTWPWPRSPPRRAAAGRRLRHHPVRHDGSRARGAGGCRPPTMRAFLRSQSVLEGSENGGESSPSAESTWMANHTAARSCSGGNLQVF